MNEIRDMSLAASSLMARYMPGETVRKKTVWSRNLSGTSKYHFCPYCMRRLQVKPSELDRYFAIARRQGRKSKEEEEFMERVQGSDLVPLVVVRNKLLLRFPEGVKFNTEDERVGKKWRTAIPRMEKLNRAKHIGVVTFETKWLCPMCKRELDEDDFSDFYAMKPDPDYGEKMFIDLDDPAELENF